MIDFFIGMKGTKTYRIQVRRELSMLINQRRKKKRTTGMGENIKGRKRKISLWSECQIPCEKGELLLVSFLSRDAEWFSKNC
jgi:hypothetical protein